MKKKLIQQKQPAGMQYINWLQSSPVAGSLNTGLIIGNNNYTIKARVGFFDTSVEKMWFGVEQALEFNVLSTTFSVIFKNQEVGSFEINNTDIYEIEFNFTPTSFNGVLKDLTTGISTTKTFTLDESFDFTQETAHLFGASFVRMYYFQVYQNSVKVRDFRPVVNAQNKPMMFCRATRKYYDNTNTEGSFFGGVDWIESTDNASFIDTGVIPNNDTSVYLRAKITELGIYTFVGTAKTNQPFYYFGPLTITGTGLYTWSYNSFTITNNYCAFGDIIDATITSSETSGKILAINMTKSWRYSTSKTGAVEVDTTMYMFANHYLNNGISGTSSNAKGIIMDCKINKDGALVKNFEPIVLSDGTGAMYDRVSNAIHGNVGTGTMKWGIQNIYEIPVPSSEFLKGGYIANNMIQYYSSYQTSDFGLIVVPCKPYLDYSIKKDVASNRFTIADSQAYPYSNCPVVNVSMPSVDLTLVENHTTVTDSLYFVSFLCKKTEAGNIPSKCWVVKNIET